MTERTLSGLLTVYLNCECVGIESKRCCPLCILNNDSKIGYNKNTLCKIFFYLEKINDELLKKGI